MRPPSMTIADHSPDVAQWAISKMMPLTPVQLIYNTEATTLTSHGIDFVTDITRFHSTP